MAGLNYRSKNKLRDDMIAATQTFSDLCYQFKESMVPGLLANGCISTLKTIEKTIENSASLVPAFPGVIRSRPVCISLGAWI